VKLPKSIIQKINNLTGKHFFLYCIIAIIIFGTCLRVIRTFETTYLQRDEILYLMMAESWDQNGFEIVYAKQYIPPMLLYLMRTFKPVFGTYVWAGRSINIISGIFFILGISYITLALFKSRKCAILAALLAAIHPYAVRLSGSCLREGWGLALIAVATAFIMYAIKRKSILCWCGGGLAIGAASLFRYESLEFLLIVLIFWIVCIIKDKYEVLPAFKAFALFSISIALMIFILSLIADIPLNYYTHNLFNYIVAKLQIF